MSEEQQDNQKRAARVRSVLDYLMGILVLLLGVYFLVYEKLGINVFRREPSSIDYLIGALFILYGVWRIYRGYKKDYYR